MHSSKKSLLIDRFWRQSAYRTQEVGGSSPPSSIANRLHAGGFALPGRDIARLRPWRWTSSGQVAQRIAARSRAERPWEAWCWVAGGRRITVFSSSGVSRPANALCAMRARMSAEWRASSKRWA
jgi:hypothetical protein